MRVNRYGSRFHLKIIVPIILIPILLLASIAHAANKKRIELDPKSTKEISAIIQQSEILHRLLYDRKDPMVQSQISLLKSNIKKAMKKFDGQHVARILGAVEKDLSSAQMTTGENRLKYLQDAFRQIVMLYQSYKTEASYKVFFCKTDRSVWIQESKKPQNPFQTDSSCGRQVN